MIFYVVTRGWTPNSGMNNYNRLTFTTARSLVTLYKQCLKTKTYSRRLTLMRVSVLLLLLKCKAGDSVNKLPKLLNINCMQLQNYCINITKLLHLVYNNRLSINQSPGPPRDFNHIGSLFTDHDRRSVGVSCNHVRHDRGVSNAQIINAVNSQSGVDNGAPVG